MRVKRAVQEVLFSHSDDVSERVILLLHDEGAGVGHLGVAREGQLPHPVGKHELLRARWLVHPATPLLRRWMGWDGCAPVSFLPLSRAAYNL